MAVTHQVTALQALEVNECAVPGLACGLNQEAMLLLSGQVAD
jgi:hypothetical protein